MSTVAEIEEAISQLGVEERKRLANWLEHLLEDLYDGLAAEEAKAELGPNIPHEQLKKELGLD